MSCGLKECCGTDCLNRIHQVVEEVRKEMEGIYGPDIFMAGFCMEASARIEEELHKLGCDKVKTVAGFVRCDYLDEETKETDMPHMWVEVSYGDNEGDFLFIDVTADQFNYIMDKEHEYAPIIVRKGYPYGVMLPNEV